MWKQVLLVGVSMLAALVVPSHAQCQINNCQTCLLESGEYKCATCQVDDYAINSARTACCSVGCYQDSSGFAACHVNQTCVYDGCHPGYIGPKCTPCKSFVPNCDSCRALAGSSKIDCVTCARGYYRNLDGTQCCSNSGCDSCTGTNNAVCSVCKPGWFLYQTSCDQCGTTCVSPSNGTARCDPVTGSCYYGCQPNYHGSKCQRLCNVANCITCTYNEPSDNLTCAVCVAGRYGPYCISCNSNCLRDTGDICIHNGTCLDGCRPGYRGDKCDVSCEATLGLSNCAVCDRYQFACTVCKPGFHGSQCQLPCGVNCVAVGGARYCNISDGTCRDGCMPTYYRHDCSGSCPNCGYDVCHRTTGTCLNAICDSGFYGETCNQSCPVNCGSDPNGNAYCNFTSGDCTYGCRDGYYGAKCTLGCSQFCKRSPANTEKGPLCNQATGNCVYACEPGSYTPTCREVCRSKCVDNTCDINSGTCAECDKGANAGVLCPTGTCSVGKFGTFCNEDCPGGAQCWNRTCNRYTSTCIGCVVGRWGDICNRTCPNCVNGLCEQSTGFCQLGCVNGYYGDNCNYRCDDRCTVCNRVNGTCEVCNVGTFGDTCQRNCSANCVSDPGQNFSTCAKENGGCTSGACKPGFFAPHCGLTCSQTCAERSLDVQVCEINTGDCVYGCDDGFYNPTCAHPCSTTCRNKRCVNAGNNCVDGCVDEYYNFPTCDTQCNSKCVNSTCDDVGGACSYGCRVGYYGNQCQLTCPSNNTCVNYTCDRMLGYCRECDLPKPGFQCREAACDVGFYGNFCTTPCPGGSNCSGSTCERYTASAKGVSAAVMATTVREHAPTVLVASVIRLPVCAKARAWTAISGTNATPRCGNRCTRCAQFTGACLVCHVGAHGISCEFNCSTQCLPLSSGIISCNKVSETVTAAHACQDSIDPRVPRHAV
ncbi:hypothetical protein DPMN_038634 [Dreissena polymorpha]|uniref:EGF-like domain-containing protein n=1 Tax=Dreissena polymorpha TaxID=45954 RepID=A0A9D4RNE5_DREPO|nr:hypothetical protein DPMN_038634 [Dreissena polymorpha]